ncbi:MAG: hypothetical protein HOM25_11385 [Rhodospirillaceae bacterium]|nr:hypothetical protein [Rhodospirillaceae bacterium]MBT5667534.1 hypothetical protein [Rhodospirillaceae bacterium]MBT5809977.1 hypothetical protein [Rhodospirillaceae bacterium]
MVAIKGSNLLPSITSRPCWVIVLAGLLMSACQTPNDMKVNANELGESFTISFGNVLEIRAVHIDRTFIGSRTLSPSAVSGIILSTALLSSPAQIMTGSGISARNSRYEGDGFEFTVTMDSGIKLKILQKPLGQENEFKVGDRVYVRNSNGIRRVFQIQTLPDGFADPKKGSPS